MTAVWLPRIPPLCIHRPGEPSLIGAFNPLCTGYPAFLAHFESVGAKGPMEVPTTATWNNFEFSNAEGLQPAGFGEFPHDGFVAAPRQPRKAGGLGPAFPGSFEAHEFPGVRKSAGTCPEARGFRRYKEAICVVLRSFELSCRSNDWLSLVNRSHLPVCVE